MKYLKFAIGLILLLILGLYLQQNWGKIIELQNIKLSEFAILYALCIFSSLFNSLVVKTVLKKLGTKTKLTEMFILQNSVNILNYLPMKFGTLFRANYLKKHYKFPFSLFASFFIYVTLIITIISSLLGAILLIIFFDLKSYQATILLLLYVFFAIFSILLLLCPLPNPKGKSKLIKSIRTFSYGRNILSKDFINILKVSFLLFMVLLISSLRLFFIYNSIGENLHPSGFLILGSLGFLSLFASFTPGALGIRETMISCGSIAIGTSLEVGIYVAMMDRAVILLYTFTVGLFCVVKLWINSPNDFKKSESNIEL